MSDTRDTSDFDGFNTPSNPEQPGPVASVEAGLPVATPAGGAGAVVATPPAPPVTGDDPPEMIAEDEEKPEAVAPRADGIVHEHRIPDAERASLFAAQQAHADEIRLEALARMHPEVRRLRERVAEMTAEMAKQSAKKKRA